MYVSSETSLYKTIYIQVAKHIDGLTAKLSETHHIGFLHTPFIQMFLRVVTSLVSFLATLYEFVMYCSSIQVSKLIL